jgi:glycosyltransferase
MIKISVITATWNCKATITGCLESVAGQTYLEREHVVIDGASSDGTLELLQSRESQIDVLVSEPDDGIYDALNKGISRSSGDVIGFLHSDDLYAHPDVLANIAAEFEKDPCVCAVYGDLQYVRKDDTSVVVRNWKSGSFSTNRLAWGWMPPHPTLYVRKVWYERIGGLDTRYRIAADYYSILQLFSQSDFKAVYIPEVLVKMRLGGASNQSLKAIIQKSAEDWHALRRMGVGAFGGVGALLWKNLSKVAHFK